MKLQLIADLLENHSETIGKISEDVYALAESRTADASAEKQGYGFDRTAIMGEVKHIFEEIETHIAFKLKNDRF